MPRKDYNYYKKPENIDLVDAYTNKDMTNAKHFNSLEDHTEPFEYSSFKDESFFDFSWKNDWLTVLVVVTIVIAAILWNLLA